MIKSISFLLLAIFGCVLFQQQVVLGRILKKCEAVQALNSSKVIEGHFISMYTCIMMYESKFDTSKKTGPGHKASYSYGVFQISSDYWCNQWRAGGRCNKKCTDFLDDDIRDDIACAKTIQQIEGFKRWKSFATTCKNIKSHPSIEECRPRNKDDDEFESDEDSEMFSETEIDVEELFYNEQLI